MRLMSNRKAVLGRVSLSLMLMLMLTLTLTVTLAAAAFGQSPPTAHNNVAHSDVLIKNATVMTATHGTIKNGSVYIKDGKIAAVGESVKAPASATVIDAEGKYLTPGIIDSHS